MIEMTGRRMVLKRHTPSFFFGPGRDRQFFNQGSSRIPTPIVESLLKCENAMVARWESSIRSDLRRSLPGRAGLLCSEAFLCTFEAFANLEPLVQECDV